MMEWRDYRRGVFSLDSAVERVIGQRLRDLDRTPTQGDIRGIGDVVVELQREETEGLRARFRRLRRKRARSF